MRIPLPLPKFSLTKHQGPTNINMMKKFKLSLVSLVCVLFASVALAGNVNLAWNASPDTNVVSYTIYYVKGTNTVFSPTHTNAVGSITVPSSQLTATVSNLTSGAWTFVATAKDATALESLDSNTAWTTVRPAAPSNLTIP